MAIMTDGHCVNCGCAMRSGRHQDIEGIAHGDICACRAPKYDSDEDLSESADYDDRDEPIDE